MKLVTFSHHGRTAIGKVEGRQVVDLPASEPSLPKTMREMIAAGPLALARAIEAEFAVTIPLADVQLLAPVPDPSKYLAIGMNYRKHVEEAIRGGIKVPDTQVWFNKQVSCINAPHGEVHLPPPAVSDQLDYEVELCVVIGKRCRHVKATDAKSVISGYMVCNDFTLRDWQMRSPTMTMGKSFNTTGPIGPWIVTADEVADPHALEMRLFVNGELRQQETTGGMVYDIFRQIEHLSTAFTLEPGDLIATGTPSGVGVAMQPPRFLKIGDVVRAEIDGLGFIEHRVVAEPV